MSQKGLPHRSFLAEGGQAQVLILAGAVLLIVAAGGIFYLGRATAPKPQVPVITSSPQPSTPADETVDWKTYTNTRYGIEFKYPPTWSLHTGELLTENHPDQERNFIQVDINNGVTTYPPPCGT